LLGQSVSGCQLKSILGVRAVWSIVRDGSPSVCRHLARSGSSIALQFPSFRMVAFLRVAAVLFVKNPATHWDSGAAILDGIGFIKASWFAVAEWTPQNDSMRASHERGTIVIYGTRGLSWRGGRVLLLRDQDDHDDHELDSWMD